MEGVTKTAYIIICVCFILAFFIPVTTQYNHTDCEHMRRPKMLTSCCKIPHGDELIQKCEKDLRQKHKDKFLLKICIAECEFKAKGYLNVSNELDLKVMQLDLQKRHADDLPYANLLMRGVHKCVEFAKNKTEEIAWVRAKNECNLFPAILLACALQEVYENCPPSKWHETPSCKRMRNYLRKCDQLLEAKQIN